MSTHRYPPLITELLNPASYNHPCGEIRCIETHISWLLLTGDVVYKIKKPVDFGFLDFSSLSRRKHFCEEEIRLNSRLAPQVYLGVVAIGRDARIHDDNLLQPENIVEYAVKMRQFDNAGLFDQLIKHDQLSPKIIRETAQCLARFHAEIAVADKDSRFGTPSAIHRPVQENFTQLAEIATDFLAPAEQQQRFAHVRRWSESCYAALEDSFTQRKVDGFIRECHGDLHLGNIVLIDGRVTPFDGIEFNPSLRWIDTMSEIAFLLMDLQDRGRDDLGQQLLNTWLEDSGDYAGLVVLRYYQCYRAMVRAKVAALTGQQNNTSKTQQTINNYIQLAEKYTHKTKPVLLITHGLSGSGKSWLSQQLLSSAGVIRLRSDVERKRLAGLDARATSQSAPDAGIYTAEFTQRTFDRLETLAQGTLLAGYRVIVDATFTRREQRDAFRRLAQSLNIPFRIIDCAADTDTLRQRVSQRHAEGHDASEAGLAVLERQIANYQPLGEDEQAETISVNTANSEDIRAIKQWFDQQL